MFNGINCAVYIDDNPVSSRNDRGEKTGTGIGFCGWSDGTTTTIVKYDNLKVWDLDKVQNLP